MVLILLPPSETKRAGGGPVPLDLDRLAFPELRPQRERAVASLISLCRDPDEAARVLRLGPGLRGEIETNTQMRGAPTMPAIDRYTGVLYDALAASTLDSAARRWLGAHVMIHSAPLGPVGALDAIPSYRLGASASIPALGSLRRHWAGAVTAALGAGDASFVLDLRSEAYVALGPVPSSLASVYVRVITAGEGASSHRGGIGAAGGAVRALNHFNKHAKGALTRRLAQDRPRIRSVAALLRWAEGAGLDMRLGEGGACVLEVPKSGIA